MTHINWDLPQEIPRSGQATVSSRACSSLVDWKPTVKHPRIERNLSMAWESPTSTDASRLPVRRLQSQRRLHTPRRHTKQGVPPGTSTTPAEVLLDLCHQLTDGARVAVRLVKAALLETSSLNGGASHWAFGRQRRMHDFLLFGTSGATSFKALARASVINCSWAVQSLLQNGGGVTNLGLCKNLLVAREAHGSMQI